MYNYYYYYYKTNIQLLRYYQAVKIYQQVHIRVYQHCVAIRRDVKLMRNKLCSNIQRITLNFPPFFPNTPSCPIGPGIPLIPFIPGRPLVILLATNNANNRVHQFPSFRIPKNVPFISENSFSCHHRFLVVVLEKSKWIWLQKANICSFKCKAMIPKLQAVFNKHIYVFIGSAGSVLHTSYMTDLQNCIYILWEIFTMKHYTQLIWFNFHVPLQWNK